MPRTNNPKALKRKPAPPQHSQPPRRNPPDWDWIEQEYRAGIRSTREIARLHTADGHPISHVAIEKRAKRDGWSRDLAKDVQRSIRNKLAAASVTKPVDAVNDSHARADAIVEAAAQEGVTVVQSHRSDVRAAREIEGMLREQLMAATRDQEALAKAIEDEAGQEGDAKAKAARRAQLAKSIGLGTRATIYRDLMHATRVRIQLERQAFNIDERHQGSTLEDHLRSLDD